MFSSFGRVLVASKWSECRNVLCKKHHRIVALPTLQHMMSRSISTKLKNHAISWKDSLLLFSFLFSTTPLVVNVHTVEISSGRQFQMDKDINDLVERGKLSLTKGEDPNQAEILYVRALHLAIQQNDHNAVAYVQDLLANLALQNGQLDKAEPLFRNILKNIISHGTPQNDPSVIEISLKLASIYARMGKKELALNGYEWTSTMCRTHLDEMKKNKISSGNGYINMKALLGMILDSYGRYLHDINDGKTALKVTLEALDICQELFGETDSRTLVLYNDLSSILLDLGDLNQAFTYVQKAITLSESNPALACPSEKAVFYTNLSYIYIKQGKVEEAKTTYKRALLEAAKSDDKTLQEHVASMVHVLPKDKN